MTDPLIGQTLGAYRITRLLKRTGMSMVYLARDDKLERDVVVKVMLPSHNDDEGFAARFHQEALATARLGHPNIIHIYDFGHRDDLYYMVMEYLPGGSLYDRLMDASSTGKRMDIAQALNIVGLMAGALDHAHRAGFVHRDVKPSNILFSQDGHPVLTDLGIVKTHAGPQLTESLSAVGTPEYMSPEQGRGDTVDARSDIYSLGVVLYELLAGGLPFRAETTWGLIYKHLHEAPPAIQDLNRSVSPALRSVVEKALAKRPEDRFGTASEFAEALKHAQAAPARRLYPPPPPPPQPDPSEFAAEMAGDKAADNARHPSRKSTGRTDIAALPGRVTPRPTPAPRGALPRWLWGVAAVLLVAAAAAVVTGAMNSDRPRAALPQATVTEAPALAPTFTRTPGSSQPATVRTAAPATGVAPTAAAAGAVVATGAQHGVATAQVAKPKALPTVVLVFSDGRVALAPYLDPAGQYGLYVPAGWSRVADGLGMSFEAPDRMARILVHQTPGGEPGESAAAIAQRYVEGARALFQGVREVRSASAVVGDLPAFEQELEAEVLNVPVKVHLLAVNAGGTGIVAVSAASAASEPAYRSLLAAVLDSFRVPASLVEPVKPIATAELSSQAPTVAPTFTPPPAATLAPTSTTRPVVKVTATQVTKTAPRPAGGVPAPGLIYPRANTAFDGPAEFCWSWDGPTLTANQGFEVRIWKEGQPVHYGAAEPTNNGCLTINVPGTYGAQHGGSGSYFWTVAVVQRKPYEQLGPEAAPRPLQVQVGGGGGGGGSATWTPPPP